MMAVREHPASVPGRYDRPVFAHSCLCPTPAQGPRRKPYCKRAIPAVFRCPLNETAYPPIREYLACLTRFPAAALARNCNNYYSTSVSVSLMSKFASFRVFFRPEKQWEKFGIQKPPTVKQV